MGGIIGLHVDDYIGGGERMNQEADIPEQGVENADCFRLRLEVLARLCNFGKWDFGSQQIFCGLEAWRSSCVRRPTCTWRSRSQWRRRDDHIQKTGARRRIQGCYAG